MESRVSRFIAALTAAEKGIAFTAFGVMLIALLADVIGRELFSEGVFGSVRVAVYALILCAMSGFGIATATGGHLRPKFMDGVLRGELKGPGVRLGQVLSAAILLYLAYAAWQMVTFTRLIEERDLVLDVLVWPIQMALPVGFVLSALRHLCFAAFPGQLPKEAGVAE